MVGDLVVGEFDEETKLCKVNDVVWHVTRLF